MKLTQVLPFCAFILVAAAQTQTAAQERHGIDFGTFSNLHYVEETGDVLGIEVTIIPQYKTAYAIFQCAEGAPTDPVFVPVELKGNHFKFLVRTGDKSCDGNFSGAISQRGMTLISNQDTYNAGGFIPRRNSYWAK